MTEPLTAIGVVGVGIGVAILLVMSLVPVLLALPLPTAERRTRPPGGGIDSPRGWADPGL